MMGTRQEREIERGPSLLDRRIAGSGGGVGGMGEGQGQAGGPPSSYEQAMLATLQAQNGNTAPAKVRRGPDVEDVSSATYIQSPDALLVRGTYLRCVLETRIITDLAGYTSCLLTEPVYSINGRNLLLPEGLQDLWRLRRRSDGQARGSDLGSHHHRMASTLRCPARAWISWVAPVIRASTARTGVAVSHRR